MQQWNLKLCNSLWKRIVSQVGVLVSSGMLQVETSKGQWLLEVGSVGWGCWRLEVWGGAIGGLRGRSLRLLGE